MKRSPMPRRKPKTAPDAKTPIRRTKVALSGGKASEGKSAKKAATKLRVYGPDARIEWMHAQPCVACGHQATDIAHVKNGGMSRKADAKWTIPCCRPCHAEIHQHGQKTFEKTHGDLMFWAQIIDARWEAYQAQTAPASTRTHEPSSSRDQT